MDEMLQKLLANQVLSESTKEEITEAFNGMIAEAKQEAEAKVRSELAERYEADKKAMVTAFEKYLEQNLNEEITEFRNDLKEVNALKKKYATAIATFKESAKKQIIAKMKMIEANLDKTLRGEIKELHEDMKVNRKSYLNAINENAAKFEEEKANFKKKAAKVLENIVNVKLSEEIKELREDIQAAKKTHFEGQLFEAFYNTFRRQFFDTNKEFKNLSEKLNESENKVKTLISTANRKIAEANKKIANVTGERNELKESMERTKTMSKLLNTLTGVSRKKMHALLEATDTKNLEKTYKKFLPDVLNENTKPRTTKRIDESVVVDNLEMNTGSRKVNEDIETDPEIIEIMRRAKVNLKK